MQSMNPYRNLTNQKGKFPISCAGRPDFMAIYRLVFPGTRVLDLNCGKGELLKMLMQERGVKGQGIDINPSNINACGTSGVPSARADISEGLSDYPNQSYDYVILNQALHQIESPDRVLMEIVRVGKTGIICFPNYGHWQVRVGLMFGGKMPRTPEMPEPWFMTKYRHLLTASDFEDFCMHMGLMVLRKVPVGRRRPLRWKIFPNSRAVHCVFTIASRGPVSNTFVPPEIFLDENRPEEVERKL
jgi:methionine biosynthesis protein MetW